MSTPIIETDLVYGCHAFVPGPQAQAQLTTTDFSMTVHFDPAKDHAAIFGEQPTFSGHTAYGNIIVVPSG